MIEKCMMNCCIEKKKLYFEINDITMKRKKEKQGKNEYFLVFWIKLKDEKNYQISKRKEIKNYQVLDQK